MPQKASVPPAPPGPALGLHLPWSFHRLLPTPLGLSDPRTHSAGSFPRPTCPRSALACTLSLPLALRRPAATPGPEPGRNPEATSVAPGVLSPTRDSAAAAPAAPHPPHRRPTTGAPPGVGTTAGTPRLRRTGLGQACDPQGGTSEFGRRGLGTERRGESPGGAERRPPAAASVVPGQRSPSRPSSAARSRQEKQEPESSSRGQPGQLAGAGAAGREGSKAGGGPVTGAGRRAGP